MEKTMIILNFLALLGFPSIFIILSALFKKMGKYSNQIKILMNAQQAQMRSQLLKDFYNYKSRGYIYESELEDWENQYKAYHALGANGIMDKRRETLFDLETRKEIDK
jgi:hypothetical protein